MKEPDEIRQEIKDIRNDLENKTYNNRTEILIDFAVVKHLEWVIE